MNSTLSNIHVNRLAKYNYKYIDSNGDVYIGTKEGRLSKEVVNPTDISNFVTYNDFSAGAGLSYDQTIGQFTNIAPDQTVTLTAGTNIIITGIYPDFTIASTIAAGDLTELSSSILTITGGVGAVIGTGTSIEVKQSSNTQNGYLSSTDWTTFNSKGTGTVTSVATTGLISGGTITGTGTITTSMNTNKLVGRSSASTGVMEEISVGSGLTLSGGTLSNTATPTATGYYGAWQDDISQTAAADNTGYAMKFRTADITPNGISIVSDTQITFANTGIYNIQFSSQFQNLSNSPQDVTIWLRKSGTDVTGSAGVVGLEARKNPGDPYHTIAGWNYVLSVVAGEYYELIWSTTDHTNVEMRFYAAGSPPPSAASVIMTVTQQSGIMSGTGITAINSLTGAAQTIVAGTSGTDFAVSSSGTAHTLNLPTASATNRGALSSTDWTTFNSKGSGTVTGVTGTAPVVSSGGTTPAISMAAATTSVDGYLSSTNFNTFNGKQTSPWDYRKAAKWYTPHQNAGPILSIANAANTIRYIAVIIDRDITITQMGINVVTIATAGNTCRIGIYSNDPTTTSPLTKLVDSGTLALDTTGPKTVTGLSIVLTKGLYWFCYFSNATTGTVAGVSTNFFPDVRGTTSLNLGPTNVLAQALAYAALPTTAGTLTELQSISAVCTYYQY